jgi:hypothetical protein
VAVADDVLFGVRDEYDGEDDDPNPGEELV